MAVSHFLAAWLCLAALTVQTLPTASPLTVSTASRAVQPGELVVLTLVSSAPLATLEARAFAHDLRPFPVTPREWQLLVGIDLDVKPGAYTVSMTAVDESGRESKLTHRLVVSAKRFPTRTLTVDPNFVNPPPDAVARIQTEARELEEIWAASAARKLWSGPFVRPVPQPANSAFGTRSVFNGQPRSPHGGADFLSPTGTPIRAPNSGQVVLAKELYYTGNTVIIDHGLGLVTLFAHLSEIDVRPGDAVTTGQVVGKVGATGRVTGPHLHWTLRVGAARVDPLSLLATLGG